MGGLKMHPMAVMPNMLSKGFNYFNRGQVQKQPMARPVITDQQIMNSQPIPMRQLPVGKNEFSGAVDSGSPLLNKVDTTNYSEDPRLFKGGAQWQQWMNDLAVPTRR